ncbi:MAG: FAD-dependent oxidoreductase, partial [Chloroflexi bacterium]|nr:FAD-dependent oxidoreductase [Chloroflexota bacterium]
MDASPEVVVLGGGVAGIATAVYLLDRGYRVDLIEARGFLGGRSFSFTDKEREVAVDNGQHVIIKGCSQYLDLLQRLGALDRWYQQPRLQLRILDSHGNSGILSSSRLPSPLHLAPSFFRYTHLGFRDKFRVALALLRAKFTDRHEPYLEHITFKEWLDQQGQTERAVQNFWNLLLMPTLNDHVQDVSAAMGLMIVQEGMLAGNHSADLGYAQDALLNALGEPAREYLDHRGARLILSSPIRRLMMKSGGMRAVELSSGEILSGRIFVSALPFDALLRVLPQEALEMPYFQRLTGLESSPIVNIHLWYDREVMAQDFCVFVDSPLQWVFNKSRIYARPRLRLKKSGSVSSQGHGAGQSICISLSAAWKYMDQPREA